MDFLPPSILLDLWHAGRRPNGPVSVDTETSGLFLDDGARVSTVSVAWEARGDRGSDWAWEQFATNKHGVGEHMLPRTLNYGYESFGPDRSMPIVSAAWPFDQGRDGKPEQKNQDTLWPDADNLGDDEYEALLTWLNLVGDDHGLIMHHAKFDCHIFRGGLRREPNLWTDLMPHVVRDTQNANHLLWPWLGHPDTGRPTTSLKPTCQVLFDAEAADEQQIVKDYLRKNKLPTGRWDLMPWDVIGDYADGDARLTLRLDRYQQAEIDAGRAGQWMGSPATVRAALDRRLETSRLLYKMEWRGLPYDEVASRDAADECIKRAAELGKRLPFKPDINSAKDFFFTDAVTAKGEPGLNHPPYEVTEKGAPSLTEEVLGRMVADGVPWAKEWAEYTKVLNAASMWYNGYAEKMGTDGRLRTGIRQNGTVSSRFSSERVNLQAIPQNYRLSSHAILEGIQTPRQIIGQAVDRGLPGWCLWELDLAQAELRVAAMWAECQTMLQMIELGEDLHGFTTNALFNRAPDDPDFGKWRQVGKRANFSLIFDAGPDTFKKMVSKETGIRLGDVEAGRIVYDWRALYPEFGEAVDRHHNLVSRRQLKKRRGWVQFLNGERRWYGPYDDSRSAFNQRVQGNLAQYGIDWMLATEQYLKGCQVDYQARAEGIGGAGLLLTIHDSQVLLLPDTDEGEKMAQACAHIGKRIWLETFPGVPGDVDLKRW